MKIGILMSGGDAPGMNSIIYAAWRCARQAGVELCFIEKGYQGILDQQTVTFSPFDSRISSMPGCVVKTGRCAEFHEKSTRSIAISNLHKMGIDGLIVCGGNGSLTGARLLSDEGFPTVGIPVTVDGDVFSTDTAIGMATAVQAVVTEIAALQSTADVYPGRIFLLETLGGKKGYIALLAGLAANADLIVIPETANDPDTVAQKVKSILGKRGSCIGVICEGALPNWKNGDQNSISIYGNAITEATGIRTRYSIIGYGLRGYSPVWEDCLLGSVFASLAVEALLSGKSGLIAGRKEGHEGLYLNDPTSLGFDVKRWINLAIKTGLLI